MTVTITKSAAEELNKKIGDQKGYLKVKNVTEGLACGAGVPTLYFVPLIDETKDVVFETNNRPVYMEKSELIFFDDELKIDYSDSVNSFQLKSPQQIINGRMSFII
ncbi:heme biosynthesis protein HemY [Oceanobacillus arenosus]|uniref:Heme biosynthesis protein HemY n=1 Tax=Oceanobacillus arenosus TaxID=1229153 RepID=A0A3D8PK00_9BACI|nr:iron-sulfur cluster biosynthesis family protein [Oceanobacillus arenosus]RDW15817.1 heme biosynthesis protein HemY [Oceanobacillus arenosus]